MKAVIAKIRRMPSGLRNISMLLLLAAVFSSVAVLPRSESLVEGDRERFRELMHGGLGGAFVAISMSCAALLYGLIAARRWARYGAVALCWAIAVAPAFFPATRSSLNLVLSVVAFGMIPTWYFCFYGKLAKYFEVDSAG